jgi:hypothetical protein
MLALAPLRSAAQGRRADARAFVTFLESLAAQRTARMCERGDPGYRQRFDQLYGRWSARHRDGIARGEEVYHETIARKNLSDSELATLEKVETILRELAQSPGDAGPIALDDRMRGVCKIVLDELEAGLDP